MRALLARHAPQPLIGVSAISLALVAVGTSFALDGGSVMLITGQDDAGAVTA